MVNLATDMDKDRESRMEIVVEISLDPEYTWTTNETVTIAERLATASFLSERRLLMKTEITRMNKEAIMKSGTRIVTARTRTPEKNKNGNNPKESSDADIQRSISAIGSLVDKN